MDIKLCSKCKKSKGLMEFHKNVKKSDGLQCYCKSCIKIKGQKYYNKNKDKINKANKNNYINNRNSHMQTSKTWVTNNREKSNKIKKDYIKNNPEKFKESQRKWRESNLPYLAFKSSKRRAAIRARIPSWANLDAIEQFYLNCPEGYEVDHIIPLQGENISGFHILENLQYLSPEENRKKGNKYNVRQ